MRRVNNILLATVVTTLYLLSLGGSVSAAPGGVTVTPATLTLTLVPESREQAAGFTITSNYNAPVHIRFSFEPRIDAAASTPNPVKQLSISKPDIIIGAGESVRQIVTVRDDDRLSPGSQLADLVLSQISTAAANVGVQPSIRLPLVVIKQAGAVADITLSKVSTPRLSLAMPDSLVVTVHNKGNVIAIPRGVVSITGPGGTVQRGVLNTASFAVSPGGDLALTTPLTNLGGAHLPGIYRASVSYGLGGDQAVLTASSRFFYIAWWHIGLLVLIGGGVYYVLRRGMGQGLQKRLLPRQAAARLLMKKRAAS